MLNPADLLLFAAAVEHGGFAAAARELGIPKSTLSKRLAVLEASLGARLVHRTSRSFTLTDLGREVHEHARAARIELDAAEQIVRRRMAEPAGTVRITASVPDAQDLLARLLPGVAQAYPALRIDLDVTDRFVDLVEEGYDLALRSHFSPLPDSGLVQRALQSQEVVLVASPGYLSAQGEPATPGDLARHDGLLVASRRPSWRLSGPQGEEAEVVPHARMAANESGVLLSAASAGVGIACLPVRMCEAAFGSGALRRVLPGWTAGTVTTSVVMPHRRGLLPAVRAVVEALVEDAARG